MLKQISEFVFILTKVIFLHKSKTAFDNLCVFLLLCCLETFTVYELVTEDDKKYEWFEEELTMKLFLKLFY